MDEAEAAAGGDAGAQEVLEAEDGGGLGRWDVEVEVGDGGGEADGEVEGGDGHDGGIFVLGTGWCWRRGVVLRPVVDAVMMLDAGQRRVAW